MIMPDRSLVQSGFLELSIYVNHYLGFGFSLNDLEQSCYFGFRIKDYE